MRKGAAVGAGSAPDQRHASDPLFPGPSLPRSVASHRLGGPWAAAGAAAASAAARVTAARVGWGPWGGVCGCFWSRVWSGDAGSKPPLNDFFAVWLQFFRFGLVFFIPFPAGFESMTWVMVMGHNMSTSVAPSCKTMLRSCIAFLNVVMSNCQTNLPIMPPVIAGPVFLCQLSTLSSTCMKSRESKMKQSKGIIVTNKGQ
ncbi:uncharacterized protein LOC133927122 [Phragmites australis]|uniref:uncharacterized protein LOC133927122 n=1 Tax=Phragmites australis TaxID=29695 RepID=UPI002D77FA7C|nr:uncharacterized protein LOC133927122 [Phragmites australis]